MNFIVEFIVDTAFELIGYLIPDLAPKSKLEKNIERLKEESWFSDLENDYRYAYIIHENRKVKKFLRSDKNIKMVVSMDEERENFIQLVKDEHAKFTQLR